VISPKEAATDVSAKTIVKNQFNFNHGDRKEGAKNIEKKMTNY